ncbi:SNF1-related protein kinase regulatory subunit gamma-like PV42a [Vigna radiata var. radiata]|uniref:SNF1-related protein kinase regulatory subunit gamma-like PV42a n=1 Tax=Vigna radiata var. radiata TaxID=3916 RepID=A0A1S3U3G2_VIGRR|nr:SNF1-related protein kinase regulatory subunit gamma-like PV42a [Vigna radiata var. radiata]
MLVPYFPTDTNLLFCGRRKIEAMQEVKEAKRGGGATMHQSGSVRLKEKTVKDMMVDRKRLVEVPYTASLAQTMNTLVANKIAAVPVAAPPGQWIGAGGSMIVESDKQTGAVRKHYIGMVTMLDIVAHIAGDDHLSGGDNITQDLDQRMSDPVSSIIGHSFEGLSLWTLNPNTSMLDCMEVFSKGVHRAMVPVDGQEENVASGVELAESASSYQILTQMDMLRFLHGRAAELHSILSRSVQDLGADTVQIYAITDRTKLVYAIKCLKAAMLNAVPIVRAGDVGQDDHKQLINGRCRKLIGTFSATDLRGCHITSLKSWLGISALAFTEEVQSSPLYSESDMQNRGSSRRELVTCYVESPLSEVIEKAVTNHVHRVWVVDQEGLLVGVVSLTDVIRVIRHSLLSDSNDQ